MFHPGGGTQKSPEKGAFALGNSPRCPDSICSKNKQRTFQSAVFMRYCSQVGHQAEQGRVPAISRRMPSAFLMGSIHKYKALSNDSVVDYRKVLAQMDKLTETDSDGTINGTDGTIIKTPSPDSKSGDYVYSRKERLLSELKRNPQITLDQLEDALSLPRRTIARDIEWLRENGYLERIGSKKSGCWHVIKELEDE